MATESIVDTIVPERTIPEYIRRAHCRIGPLVGTMSTEDQLQMVIRIKRGVDDWQTLQIRNYTPSENPQAGHRLSLVAEAYISELSI